jgi:hypothetical protein
MVKVTDRRRAAAPLLIYGIIGYGVTIIDVIRRSTAVTLDRSVKGVRLLAARSLVPLLLMEMCVVDVSGLCRAAICRSVTEST